MKLLHTVISYIKLKGKKRQLEKKIFTQVLKDSKKITLKKFQNVKYFLMYYKKSYTFIKLIKLDTLKHKLLLEKIETKYL